MARIRHFRHFSTIKGFVADFNQVRMKLLVLVDQGKPAETVEAKIEQ